MKTILIVVLLTLGYLYGMSKLEVMHRSDLARIPTIVQPDSNQLIENKESNLSITISGAINNAGKYKISKGSTMQDLIEKAGGLKEGADHSTFHLHYNILDLDAIYIGFENGGNKISLNTADANTLAILPGIGVVIAQRIIDYRNSHGEFGCLNDVCKVSGIGDAVFAKIRELIRL